MVKSLMNSLDGKKNDERSTEAINSVIDGLSKWRWKQEVDTRVKVLRRCSEILRERADEFAEVMAIEMGKPIAQGKGEVLKCATITDYYADNGVDFLKDEVAEVGFSKSYVSKEPLGVVLLLMPWNFPFWQVFRQAAAALVVGNTVACKHAPNVPKSAVLIEEVINQATTDSGVGYQVYVNLPMHAEDIGPVMGHREVRAVSLTGSSAAGAIVGSASSKLLKPSVLELGGNDPTLVLDDADLDLAATAGAAGRMLNAGQSCIGSKRFVVVDSVYDQFIEKFIPAMESYTHGNPLDAATKLGPLVNHSAMRSLAAQEAATAASGTVLLKGGMIEGNPGAFYLPCIIGDVSPGTPGYEDELFGPVASVIRVKDEEEAIAVANSSKYGLGASIYTKDLEKGARLSEKIDAGMCFINDFVKSHPGLPFGGVKQSGYGRECSRYGIQAFCNVKSVVFA
eukprot:TRINITY_DN6080_c0_g2_i2.p1 TRINITY_DN6080_c0_g2~~TRINITY_DN6080_c0_g2_i2.p1  ORF type:complete len:453 (+),score=110.06 TRINITY_DN6080_c0_g2_i2:113-1471(+)